MMSQQLLKAVKSFLRFEEVVKPVRHSSFKLLNSRQLAKVLSESGGEHSDVPTGLLFFYQKNDVFSFYRTRVRSSAMLVTHSFPNSLTPVSKLESDLVFTACES